MVIKTGLWQCFHKKTKQHLEFDISSSRELQLLQQWDINVSTGLSTWIYRTVFLHDLSFVLRKFENAEFEIYRTRHQIIRMAFNLTRIMLYQCDGIRTPFLPIFICMVGRFFLLQDACSKRQHFWSQRLTDLQISLSMYTKSWITMRNCVYVYLSPESAHSYIGATSMTMSTRHANRVRTLKQFQLCRFIQCEPSIKYWAATKSIAKFVPIVVQLADSQMLALSQEAELQRKFQPSLNMPWIAKHFNGTTKKVSHSWAAVTRTTAESKLFKRFRTCTPEQVPKMETSDVSINHAKAWQHIHALGSFTFSRFQTCRQLRRASVSPSYMFLIFKMAQHADEPYRTRAIRAIRSILAFKNLPLPSPPRPLALPFLAHDRFPTAARQFFKNWIRQYKQFWPPFHWPSSTMLEGRHQTIADVLHNWRSKMTQWSLQAPQHCSCFEILQRFPDLPQLDGHIGGGFQSSHLPKDLQFLATACTKDGCFMGQDKYVQYTSNLITKWLSDDAPPSAAVQLCQEWEQFVHAQWHAHHEVCSAGHRFNIKDIQTIVAMFPGCVFHCEDHMTHRLCIFCPLRYHKVLKNTFGDSAVFETLTAPPSVFKLTMQKRIPAALRKKFSWGLHLEKPVSKAYVLVKGKKQYQKGRPIIASRGSTCGPLLAVLGKLLRDLLPVVYPKTFGNNDVDGIFKSLHAFLRFHKKNNTLDQVIFDNDDLKGFFTSVPHDDIMMAVTDLVVRYCDTHPSRKPFAEIEFSIPRSKDGKATIIQGKSFKRYKKNFHVFLRDIPDLARLALSFSFFTCMDTVYRQRRGAVIGGHASPALCSLAVAYKEHIWFHTYQVIINPALHSNQFLCHRYVDNRATFKERDLTDVPTFSIFSNLEFYDSPIELEPVGSLELLGYNVDVAAGKCEYIVPAHPFCYRSPRSAGSTSRILSGLQARLHLLYRGTFPRSLSRQLVSQLLAGYESKGFDPVTLRRIALRVSCRYL